MLQFVLQMEERTLTIRWLGPLTAPVTHLVLQAHPATAPSLPAFSRDVGMSCISIV